MTSATEVCVSSSVASGFSSSAKTPDVDERIVAITATQIRRLRMWNLLAYEHFTVGAIPRLGRSKAGYPPRNRNFPINSAKATVAVNAHQLLITRPSRPVRRDSLNR